VMKPGWNEEQPFREKSIGALHEWLVCGRTIGAAIDGLVFAARSSVSRGYLRAIMHAPAVCVSLQDCASRRGRDGEFSKCPGTGCLFLERLTYNAVKRTRRMHLALPVDTEIEVSRLGLFRSTGGTMMSIEERLQRIEDMLVVLVERQQVREYYSIDQFAALVGKACFTCREWARLGRIKAEKRNSGRGAYASWVVSHEELLRYQREGLLPLGSRAL